jgi:hypothetical protein
MDHSTEGVTLIAAFVSDILGNYQQKKQEYKGLFAISQEYDLTNPMGKVPMQVYNDSCTWIEKELGKFNLIRVGRTVGETAFASMKGNGLVSDKSTPLQAMQALAKVAQMLIYDPKKRGWEIVSSEKNAIVMRRTQTFNRQLQLGLLDAIVRKTGAGNVRVDFSKSIEAGDEFDEYLISWL